MRAGIQVALEEYLNTSYSPDLHYIEGRLVERNVGEKEHSRMQAALIRYLARYRQIGLESWPEQRIQITRDHYRVADLCVTEGEPAGQIFTDPPLICIEILSRRDSLSELQETIDDYVSFGVPYSWIVDPWKRVAYVGSAQGFERVADRVFRTAPPHPDLVISIDELYSV